MQSLLDQCSPQLSGESCHSGICVGHVAEVSTQGEVFVQLSGGTPEIHRTHIVDGPNNNLKPGDRVLIYFEPEELPFPIVLGRVMSTVHSAPPDLSSDASVKEDARKEAVVDGRTITLTGRETVQLLCGKSSITLHKDGKILVKGTHLVSHASRTNRIKGSSVAIN